MALNEIGNIYTMWGQYKSAIEYHKKALIIREIINDSVYLMFSYYDIAMDYFNADSIDIALNYFEKAENIARLENNKYTLFRICNGMEVLFSSQKDYEKSAQYLSEMQRIADELKMKNLFSILYDRLYNYSLLSV